MCDSCVSFDESLRILNVQNIAGSYGLRVPGAQCLLYWETYQRQAWYRALSEAQDMIQRELGHFLCPTQICDEVHFIDENIVLKQTPVLALGSYTYSDWTEVALTGGALGEVNTELCILDTDLPADFSIGDIEFKYPVAIDEIYGYDQCLQSPNPVYQVDCDGLGNPGWKFTWQQYQLIPPDTDTLEQESDPSEFVQSVQWRTKSVDSTTAVSPITLDTDCTPPNLTAVLVDGIHGVTELDAQGDCVAYVQMSQRVKFNYITTYDCETGNMPWAIRRAVVLLALHLIGDTPAKPCECDNDFIDKLLKIDDTAMVDLSRHVRFGPTVAAMQAQRIVDNYMKRPKVNAPMEGAGALLRKHQFDGKKTRVLRRFR
jgi:hypothetical protein